MNRFTLLLIVSAFSFMLQSQTVAQLFVSMPESHLPGFSESNKILLTSDTKKSTVPYSLGEIVKEVQTDDYMRIKTSEVGTLQLKLLPVKRDSVIVCLIRTVCPNFCDSNISFYTTDWNQIPENEYLPNNLEKRFTDIIIKGSKNGKNSVSLPDIFPINAELVPNKSDLVLTLNYGDYLTEEQKSIIDPLEENLHLKLKWRRGRFR